MNLSWRNIWIQPADRRSLKWAKRIIIGFFCLAVLHPFIANDVPLIGKTDQGICLPVFQKLFGAKHLQENNYQWKLYPPIPYTSASLDINNSNYKSPFAKQNTSSIFQRHWLGTDQLGRDTLAGLLYGIWIALLIGIAAAFCAVAIGVTIGLVSGYFHNDKIKLNLPQLCFGFIIGGLLMYQLVYGFIFGSEMDWLFECIIFVLLIGLLTVLTKWGAKLDLNKFAFPIDSIVMRILEVFKSIPNIFLILACLVVFTKPQLSNIVWVIAFVSWPISCRYTRAEVLAVKSEDYIKSAESLGVSKFKIITRHILPNVIGPALITFAFTISSAIVIEAVLSFLGFGLSVDQVTWGSMLSEVRQNYKAWWLILFPGILLFMLIVSFNVIADEIALSLKKR